MQRLIAVLAVAVATTGAFMLPAYADSTVACPLFQATRTIAEPLSPGWSIQTESNPITDYRVDNQGGQEVLTCDYGNSGLVQRPAPPGEDCSKAPGRKFRCITVPPPRPSFAVISDGPLTIADNGVAELDNGGQPDIRLRADNPLLRLLAPINGARLSPQGTHMPAPPDCRDAPYSGAPIPQTQLPPGVWVCVNTSDGNFGRIRIVNVLGIAGLPVPMTIQLDHTTWAANGPGLGGPGGPGRPGGFGGGAGRVHASGTVVVAQTFSVDLDEGQQTTGSDADLWFEAVTVRQLLLKPVNGAQIAVGDRSERGFRRCSTETFSSDPVSLEDLPVGSFVCVATNRGHVGQIRVNDLSRGFPKNLTLDYTTWE